MYDKPVNSMVHMDSAGHVDIENFGAVNPCAESLFTSLLIFFYFRMFIFHFHFRFLRLHFPNFAERNNLPPLRSAGVRALQCMHSLSRYCTSVQRCRD